MVRNTDPITSRLSDLKMSGKRAINEQRVLALLAEQGPLTSKEISLFLDIPYVTVSPLMRPMQRDGKVHEQGTRRNPESGHLAVCWALGGHPGGMGPVSTGPQGKKPFKRFESWTEFVKALGWTKDSKPEEIIASINEEIVRRIA